MWYFYIITLCHGPAPTAVVAVQISFVLALRKLNASNVMLLVTWADIHFVFAYSLQW